MRLDEKLEFKSRNWGAISVPFCRLTEKHVRWFCTGPTNWPPLVTLRTLLHNISVQWNAAESASPNGFLLEVNGIERGEGQQMIRMRAGHRRPVDRSFDAFFMLECVGHQRDMGKSGKCLGNRLLKLKIMLNSISKRLWCKWSVLKIVMQSCPNITQQLIVAFRRREIKQKVDQILAYTLIYEIVFTHSEVLPVAKQTTFNT